MSKMITLIDKIISNRGRLIDSGIAHNPLNKLVAIGKIKKHIDLVRNKTDKMISVKVLYLKPEFELIMPGRSSKYYDSMTKNLKDLMELAQQNN